MNEPTQRMETFLTKQSKGIITTLLLTLNCHPSLHHIRFVLPKAQL